MLKRPVDIVVLNGAPPDLVHRVLRDGVLLYEGDRHARRLRGALPSAVLRPRAAAAPVSPRSREHAKEWEPNVIDLELAAKKLSEIETFVGTAHDAEDLLTFAASVRQSLRLAQ